ncbi:Chitinase domain-containing protein 1 [Vitis vinifera]|uniref:Chitinase domain-containing protein 1 n=1 Tax=Vitis vinifera TaxID=29760 RepID=A0A438JMC6_VITVI|nr:Chitinase domain-containing protein 1 [Vitis vinifera]
MAKRREGRVPSSSDRREDRVEASKRAIRRGGDSASSPKINIVLFLFVVIAPAIAVLVYRIRYAPRTNRALSSYVHQQGLVKADVNYQEILTENSKVSKNMSQRHYTYPVLAYITPCRAVHQFHSNVDFNDRVIFGCEGNIDEKFPWLAKLCRNNKGYDLAKSFNSKFTHLSPIWYDLRSQGTNLVLEGRHNADIGWITELRMKGDAWVIPRVVLEAIPKELLRKKKQRDKAIEMIITECKEMDYDGIVLESWSRWAAYGILHDPVMRNMALQFIKQLGQALHSVSSEKNGKQGLQLIYVIGPPRSEKLQEHDFGPADLRSLSDYVDGFSLMTYDFSGPHNPGPNAPLKWIHSTLQLLLGSVGKSDQSLARKILLGINFYGNDFALSKAQFDLISLALDWKGLELFGLCLVYGKFEGK